MSTKRRVLRLLAPLAFFACLLAAPIDALVPAVSADSGDDEHSRGRVSGRRLFERETFGGNSRTCLTCHGRETGTVSPADAQQRFLADPADPLFRRDGSPRRSAPSSITHKRRGCRAGRSWRSSWSSSTRDASSARERCGNSLGLDTRPRYRSAGPSRRSAGAVSSRTCRSGRATRSRATVPCVTAARC